MNHVISHAIINPNKYTMDYSKCTKLELITFCKELKIGGYSGKKKNEIMQMLSGHDLVQPISVALPNLKISIQKVPNVSTDVKAKPFIKWVGGKTQILGTVLDMFPQEFNNYHEPFLGGGSVLIGFLMKLKEGLITVHGTVHASDLNLALISVYKNIQSNPHAFIEDLKRLISQYKEANNGTYVNRKPETLEEALTSEESYYYYIRKKYNALDQYGKMTTVASAMFVFMNKTCFRGVYREGPNGFNVPFGHNTNVSIMDEGHILFISELIKDVVFSHSTYNESLSHVESGDFVYLDPPYAPENDTSFVSYNACGFNITDHTSLFQQCADMKEKNVKFILSNSDVPIVKDAFPVPLFKIKIVSCRRAINSTDPSARTNEVLISN